MIEVQKVSLQIKKAKILENVDFTCQKDRFVVSWVEMEAVRRC